MMGMASFTKDENKIKEEFYSLHSFIKNTKSSKLRNTLHGYERRF